MFIFFLGRPKNISSEIKPSYTWKLKGLCALDSGLPRWRISRSELGDGVQASEAFVRLELAKSKAEARRLIKGGGARIDGVQIQDENLVIISDFFSSNPEVMLSAGKKKHGVLELTF